MTGKERETGRGGEGAVPKHTFLPPAPRDAADLEVEHHLAELADRLVHEGMTPEDARREAERRFGDAESYRAVLERDERRRRMTMKRTEWWGVFTGGVGRAVRSLRRNPGFSAGVVLTLALGIGANAAMFGVLDRLLFQPPADIANPGAVRRVKALGTYPGVGLQRSGIGTYLDYRDLEKVSAFQGVAAYSGVQAATVGSGPDATRVQEGLVTWNFFPLLGVHAERGRFFGKSDDREGATPTAVVSHEYWRSKMGGDPNVLGRTLEIRGHSYTVVGVAPPGFTGVDLKRVDVWVPLVTAGVFAYGDAWLGNRNMWWLDAVARLTPGAGVPAAEAEATAAHLNGRREDIDKGNYPKDARIALDPLITARGPEASGESKVARWLGGVSLLVLLIACANVANLLLARGSQRRREVAVRLALGVRRARLVTSMVIESVLLAFVGGAVALAFATWGGGVIRRTLLPGVFFPESAVSPRVLIFILIAAVVAGLLAGVGPALQATRSNLTDDLAMGAGNGSGRRSWTRATLTVLQAALSVVLLVGAGLFVSSLSAVRRADLGLDVHRLVLANLEFETRDMKASGMEKSLLGDAIASDALEQNQIYRKAMERLSGLSGVDAVAGTNSPFQWAFGSWLKVPGVDSIPQLPGGGPYWMAVTPGYFRAVGLRVTRGRAFRDSDHDGAELVAVVSERMARTLWPDESPLGKCIHVDRKKPEECTTVVGVVEDAAREGIKEGASMTYYMPLAQKPDSRINAIYLRAAGDPSLLAARAAPILRGLDPRIRYASVAPLQAKLDPQERSWTLGATMFTVFGLLALVVASVGLYGVLAFDVAQRTRELGIRTALGAERGLLLRGVVVDGVRMAGAGVVLGLGIALMAAPHIQDLLFEVSPRDPHVFTGVALALVLVALVAGVVPGLRATRVDPMAALRTE